jgi:hypothetical protein
MSDFSPSADIFRSKRFALLRGAEHHRSEGFQPGLTSADAQKNTMPGWARRNTTGGDRNHDPSEKCSQSGK